MRPLPHAHVLRRAGAPRAYECCASGRRDGVGEGMCAHLTRENARSLPLSERSQQHQHTRFLHILWRNNTRTRFFTQLFVKWKLERVFANFLGLPKRPLSVVNIIVSHKATERNRQAPATSKMRSIVLLALAPLAMGFAPAFSPAFAAGEALMTVRAMPS